MSKEKHIQDLKEIRSLMEQSNRFLSLSGWSGIMAGIYALIGAGLAYHKSINHITTDGTLQFRYLTGMTHYFVICVLVMTFAIVTGVILTHRKASKEGKSIANKSALRMLAYIGYPLVLGGIFSVALVLEGSIEFVAPTMLIFYGLGLINGSKFTLRDIRSLGIILTILGVICLFALGYGLFFWAFGFGIMHIAYGTYMYFKYERN